MFLNLELRNHSDDEFNTAIIPCPEFIPFRQSSGVEKGVTYRFVQSDETNYYHPLGLAYYPDGAHDDVDELEPGVSSRF